MIDLDGIDLLGYEKGESGWHIDPEAGFKIGAGINDVQWVEKKIGAVPLADPRKPNMELEIPLIYVAEDDDEILSAVGELAEKSTAFAAAAPTGGTEITWQKLGAAYPSTLDCLWLEVGEVAITVEDQRLRVGRLTIKITCAPYIFGPWYTAASGFKPTGMIAVDAEIEDAKGDLPGQAKLELTNAGTVAQQFVNAGIQWRHADADDSATLLPSTFDYSTAPLNGSYTAGTNEVQTLTKTGTVSGGTWPLSWEGQVFSTGFAHNASVATVQAAIDAVIGAGNITVGGTSLDAGNMTFTFVGLYAATNVASLTFSTASLTGGGSVALSTTTPGVAGYVANTSLQSEWSSFVRTAGQTDVGDYEIWALVQTSASANDCLVRATVSVGDAASGTTNLLAAVPASAVPIWVNLGPAHIKARASGTHRWQVTVAAKTLGTAGTYCRVLAVQKKPTELGRILVKSPQSDTQVAVYAYDQFTQSAGALSGKTAGAGGTWTVGGDGGDFQVNGSGRITRTVASDAAGVGQYGYLGAAIAGCRIYVRGISATVVDTAAKIGALARLQTGTGDCFAAVITPLTASGGFVTTWTCGVYTRASGTWTAIQTATTGLNITEIDLFTYADGLWNAYFYDGYGLLAYSWSGFDAKLVTGGALASGRACIYDEWQSATAGTRTYDYFQVNSVSSPDAAIHPSQDAAWQPDGSFEREASSGTYWAYAAGQQGAGVPRLGPAGDESLINRLTIATADQNPDYAATGNQAAPFSWVLKHRPAYILGRHEA